MAANARYRLSIDVGGTFMDFVLLDESTGQLGIGKESSLPTELAHQCLEGIGRFGVDTGAIGKIFHGMTVKV